MDRLQNFYDAAIDYPRTILCDSMHDCELLECERRVIESQRRLFVDEKEADIDFWQFDYEAQGFTQQRVHNQEQLDLVLRISAAHPQQFDPKCRFVFIRAPHSQERLNITNEMLFKLFTYHQVTPKFLDYLSPFGRPRRGQDMKFSAFRQDTSTLLPRNDYLWQVPELDRSGRVFQICYNLRSVEMYQKGTDYSSPWSIRQVAIHHSFDICSGLIFWTIIKGSTSIRDRIISACRSNKSPEMRNFGNIAESLLATLFTHLVICDTSLESWGWYISYLEEEMQKATEKVIDAPIGASTGNKATMNVHSPDPIHGDKIDRSRTRTFTFSRSSTLNSVVSAFKPRFFSKTCMQETQATNTMESERKFDTEFPFEDLQRVQYLFESLGTVSFSLKTNKEILRQLIKFYTHMIMISVADMDSETEKKVQAHFDYFQRRIESICDEFQIQELRVDTLVTSLLHRKNLLQNIHGFLSTRASQQSAEAIGDMTTKMHDIALKTKQETVSMRIITLVTLFFLPGTFISTMMSTDIIQFEVDNDTGAQQRLYSSQALYLFLSVSLPMMCLVFVAWYCIYWWVNHKDKVRIQREFDDWTGLKVNGTQFFGSAMPWNHNQKPHTDETRLESIV